MSGADSQVDDLSSEVALLCLSAAGREPHYFGPSSAVSFSRIASQTMGIRHSQVPEEVSASSVQPARPGTSSLPVRDPLIKTTLPPEASSASYVQAYFANIHPQYPMLHEPTFEKWQSECRAVEVEDSDLGRAKDVSVFFVTMVYAIGCLTLGPAHYEAAEDLYAMALDRIAPVLDMDSLESIQSLLCCAVYSIRSPVGASLWKVSGMAIRHCVELGYHRSAQRFRSTADALTKEMSLRCFWVAYDIDRVAANILGRPEGISDHFIDAEYPLDIDDEYITTQGILQEPRSSPLAPPTRMSGAIHVTKLRRLWSKFNMQIYQTMSGGDHIQRPTQSAVIQQLRHELDDWLVAAPDLHQMSPSQPRSTFASHRWFRLAYYHSILLLYRPFITGTPGSAALPPIQRLEPPIVEKAFEECHQHAQEICQRYRKVFQSPSMQLTWGGLHILFLAALTYLYTLWQSPKVRASARQSQVVNTCVACTTVLVIIAERWPSAASYRNLFESLSERTINMICGEPLATTSEPPRNDLMRDPGGYSAQSSAQDWSFPIQDLGMPGTQNLLQGLMQGIYDSADTSVNDAFNFDTVDFGAEFDWQG